MRSRCVWRGGVAEQMLSGLCAIAQLEMGYNATVSLAVHACQRAQSVASPERRENARHLDLFHARVSTAVRGRCLRRSRATRARGGQLQRACDGRGMYCGQFGGGRVLVGAIYSDFKVGKISFGS